MTRVFEKQKFSSFYDDGGHVFEDLEFRRCYFQSSAISITCDLASRSTVHNMKIIDCEEGGCFVHTAIVEDVLIDGFKTHGLFQAFGAVYKHVTLRGRLGDIMLSPAVMPGSATKDQQRAFDEANASYYEGVDWALDISEAECQYLEIRGGVPVRLIRRDPETQMVFKREKVMQGKWRKLEAIQGYWAGILELFLQLGTTEEVLVAPKRDRRFRELADGLQVLRDAGVAEPD